MGIKTDPTCKSSFFWNQLKLQYYYFCQYTVLDDLRKSTYENNIIFYDISQYEAEHIGVCVCVCVYIYIYIYITFS